MDSWIRQISILKLERINWFNLFYWVLPRNRAVLRETDMFSGPMEFSRPGGLGPTDGTFTLSSGMWQTPSKTVKAAKDAKQGSLEERPLELRFEKWALSIHTAIFNVLYKETESCGTSWARRWKTGVNSETTGRLIQRKCFSHNSPHWMKASDVKSWTKAVTITFLGSKAQWKTQPKKTKTTFSSPAFKWLEMSLSGLPPGNEFSQRLSAIY